MSHQLEHILFQDEWTSTDRDALARACEEDPSLSKQIRSWARVSRAAGERFRREMPDSELLVLYALSGTVHKDALTTQEIDLLDQVQRTIESSTSRDTIMLILERIREDALTFSQVWSEATATVAITEEEVVADPASPQRSPARRSDRAAKPLRTDRPLLHRLISPSPVLRWGYAAAAMIAFLAVAVVLTRQLDSPQERFSYTALEGQMHIVNLPDGSTVRLVDGAEMSHAINPSGFDRHVSLEGQAFFDVAKDPIQFVVQTGNSVVSVFGTSFGVAYNARESITEVVLVSGSVRIEAIDDPASGVFLEPGQLSRVLGSAPPLEPANVNVDQALRWTNLFIFRETTLADAVRRLSESFDIEIEVDEAIAGRTVTGTFAREQGLKSILEALGAALRVEVSEMGDSGGFRIS